MSADFAFDSSREAYLIEGPGDENRYRLVVPRQFVEDELGDTATEDMRRDWLVANLPNILAAYTARVDGGWVKAPWNRVLVEEID